MDSRERKSIWYILSIIVLGIVINFLGNMLAQGLQIGIYLDSTGTILAAAIGGYLPAVCAGFITNQITGLIDTEYIFYGVINVLIALIAASYSWRKKGLRRWSDIPVLALALAATAGLLAAFLTWSLSGGGFGDGLSGAMARSVHQRWHLSVLVSQMLVDFLIDLADKLISVGIVVALMKALPEKMRPAFQKAAKPEKPGSGLTAHSLKMKVVLLMTAAMSVIGIGIAQVSISQYSGNTIGQYTEFARNNARLAASYINPDMVCAYLEEGEAAEGYLETKDLLQKLADSSPDIEFVYAYQIREDGCHTVFDTDIEGMEGDKPGVVVPFDDSFKPYIPALLKGEEIEPVIARDTYGHYLTVYIPVRDSMGICQCYAGIDVSMERLASAGRAFLTRILSLFFSILFLVLCIGVFLADRKIVSPVNEMAEAVGRFAYTDEEARKETIHQISSLQIQTGDEIEHLYKAIDKTACDTVRYIEESQERSRALSRMQDNMIVIMADMVENRDKTTGDHIKNTARYTRMILEEMRRKGMYKDVLTDEYIDTVVRSAPLHDIGKITIRDAILNKPGQLTEEERSMMRKHAAAGGQIVENAIMTLSKDEAGYLQQARNMANYHHERWDGTGYPLGLRGEEIPLAARVMAVADVFDALVSPRSYKPSIPVETALAMIEDGKGTHFDPEIAQAFLDAYRRERK